MLRSVVIWGFAVVIGLFFGVGARIADADIVGAWLFDEEDGDTAVDSSGRGVDGVIVGDPERVDGQFGGALKLEPNKYVDFPPPLSEMMILERDFTCMAWVHPNEWNARYQGVISMQAGSSGGETYGLYFSKGGQRVAIYMNMAGAGGQSLETDLGTLELATWTHAAITYDGSKLIIYINGEVAAQKDLSGDLDNNDRLGRLVLNGNYNALNADLVEWISATVDEVLIFDNALTKSEVQGYMNNGFEVSQAVEPTARLTTTWGKLRTAQ